MSASVCALMTSSASSYAPLAYNSAGFSEFCARSGPQKAAHKKMKAGMRMLKQPIGIARLYFIRQEKVPEGDSFLALHNQRTFHEMD
jgi:hypothetical protein